MLSTWLADISPDCLGAVASVSMRKLLNGKNVVEIHALSKEDSTANHVKWTQTARKRARALATLVLCAPDQIVLDELTTTVENSVRVLDTLLSEPVVLAGGGGCDVMLAAHLRVGVNRIYLDSIYVDVVITLTFDVIYI